MKRVPIGIDLDGVLCDWETPFKEAARRVLRRRKFEDTWNFGLNAVESSRVVEHMMQRDHFWISLQPRISMKTFMRIDSLPEPFDVYFITNRMGQNPLKQSTQWLRQHAIWSPSVIVAREKGQICRHLGVCWFLDDNTSNCLDVRRLSPETRVACLSQPWNRKDHDKLRKQGVGVVKTVNEFLDAVERI